MEESEVSCKKLPVEGGVSGLGIGKLFRVESQSSPRTCTILLKNSSDVGTRGIHREGNLGVSIWLHKGWNI